MSNPPWILQAAFGITSDSASRGSNDVVPNPSSTTPATFSDINWDDAGDLTPKTGVYTLMGPGFRQAQDGYNIEYIEDGGQLVKAAIAIMRNHGYQCKLPPKNHPCWDGSEYSDEEEEERDFLDDNYYQAHEVFDKKSKSVAFVVTAVCDWIYIRCMTEESKEFAMEYIVESDEFCTPAFIAHKEITETVEGATNLTVTLRSGNKNKNPASITTLFEMKLGTKTIAKSLCTYTNSNLSSAGPTIERLEVAKEWRRHGYGSKLVKAMETFYGKEFIGIYQAMFHVTEIDDRCDFLFFASQGFSDLSGIGEELGKHL